MYDACLDRENLLQEARQATGLVDFGAPDFEEGLRLLLDTYRANGYGEKGFERNRKRLLKILSSRLRIESALQNNPDIRKLQIRAPLYVTGLPRTGTSALLRLLSEDSNNRPLALWEALKPYPISDSLPKECDPRYLSAVEFCRKMLKGSEKFSSVHHFSADSSEECIHLLNHTFQDVQYGAEPLMEPYGSWFHQHDLRPSYRYYADILRLLQWQRPGRRWLLKSPCHLLAIDVLAEIFPDGSFVFMHRNPAESVASYASMISLLMSERANFSKRELGPVVLEYLAKKVERSMSARMAIEESRMADVHYHDFLADPIGEIHRIYEHFSIELSNEDRRSMVLQSHSNPPGRHGEHDYRLQDFGLSYNVVIDRFSTYIHRFDIQT